jgi:alkylation response protein AidB-like acyl-CoA dehydrogenase
MDFSFSDEQQMLLDSTQRLIASEYGFESRMRVLQSETGWSRAMWTQLAELGLLAIDVPEAEGGIGAGSVGVMLVANAIGAGLLLEPFHASAIEATRAIVTLATPTQRSRWLPPLIDGSMIAVLAHHEDGAAIDVSRIATRARRDGDGWRLYGRKTLVQHASAANLLLVSARVDDDGLGLFALAPDAQGVRRTPYVTVDGQRADDINFDGARVVETDHLGNGNAAGLQATVDYGLAALCADAMGVLERIHRATVDYSRSRHQFGVPIGSFQALQHRMADMQMHLEQARSMSYQACAHADHADAGVRRRALSQAKVLMGQAARFIGQQAVQLHGGMGMTDELDVSHCFKRLLAFELRGGTTDEHLAICAQLLRAA